MMSNFTNFTMVEDSTSTTPLLSKFHDDPTTTPTTTTYYYDDDEKSNSDDMQFLIGIALSVTASFCSSVSLAVQRLSHIRNESLPEEERRPSQCQILNILGVLLLFVGSLVDFAAFGFAPATIISCMGSLTLVLNMILAPIIVGESVSVKDFVVNVIVIIGTLISVWFGPHDTPAYDLDDLTGLLHESSFLMYQGIFCTWLVCLLLVWLDLRNNNNNDSEEEEDSKVLLSLDQLTRQRLLRFSYPALAGTIGGLTAAYAKAAVELIKTSILGGDNQFAYLGTYVIVTILIVCVVLQIRFLNAGLQRYEAMYVVPVYQVFWIISGILAGMFYFHEINELSQNEVKLFAFGAVISITGIVIHSKRTSSSDDEDVNNVKSEIGIVEIKPSTIRKSPQKYKRVSHSDTIDTDTTSSEEEESSLEEDDDSPIVVRI